MQIKPVEHQSAPGYPDKYAEESKQALAMATPRRWIAAPLAAGLAATVAIGLSGCDYTTGGMPVQTPITTIPLSMEAFSEAKAPRPGVIPLFDFGGGSGVIGCEVVNAPMFLSEEEAFAILSAAFAEAGLELSSNTKQQKATLPVTQIYERIGNQPKDLSKTTQGDLLPDGLVNDMPVEFVSISDIYAWERKDNEPYISVGGFSTIGAAKILSENNPGLVVFYDPVNWVNHGDLPRLDMEEGEDYGVFIRRYDNDRAFRARYEAARDKAYSDARAQSEQQLRQQAQAFIEWLSAENTR